MMDDRRDHPRIPLCVEVKISHPQIGEKIVKTRDFSEGGIFILVEPSALPPVGEFVDGQVQGMAEDAPIVQMKIVRMEMSGLGLQYILDNN